MKRRCLTCGVFGMMFSWTLYGASVESKKGDIEVFSEASSKSSVLETLKEGETLDAVERNGMFWEVKTKNGAKGFVPVLKVKHKPNENENLAKAIKGAVQDGRESDDSTDARQRSAVMGVRGLKEDDQASEAGNVRPNLRAVYEMEDFVAKRKKIESLEEKIMNEIEKKASKKQ